MLFQRQPFWHGPSLSQMPRGRRPHHHVATRRARADDKGGTDLHAAATTSRHVLIAAAGFVTLAAARWMYVGAVAEGMRKISYAGYRFPPEVIHQAIWLYLRFTLSFRDVEDLLAERGIAVSYETVRRWLNHFGPMIAAHLGKRRPKPHATWHLDEVYLKIDGRMVYLWRAVDAEGEVLDVLVQSKRNRHAALKLMRKLLKKYAFVPERLVTDDLRSYPQRPAISASNTCMSAAGGRTIGPRTPINRPVGGSARCSASRAPAPHRNSSQPTPPCTTLSMSNAISRQLNPTACSAPRRRARGARSSWPNEDPHPLVVRSRSSRRNVTMSSKAFYLRGPSQRGTSTLASQAVPRHAGRKLLLRADSAPTAIVSGRTGVCRKAVVLLGAR